MPEACPSIPKSGKREPWPAVRKHHDVADATFTDDLSLQMDVSDSNFYGRPTIHIEAVLARTSHGYIWRSSPMSTPRALLSLLLEL